MSKTRNSLLIGAACAALLTSPAAFAQDAATSDTAAPAETTTVVVTGTRIKRPNLKSNSPITTVDSAEIKSQGATTVESVLNNLPQVTSSATQYSSNGSDGTSQVNLRNLGTNRNLVLIDGQRALPAEGSDLNFIPTAMVDRVDVVTGGASAVYGSDAISGVVNFVLKKNLTGIHLDAQYGYAEHTNDDEYSRSVIESKGYDVPKTNITDGSTYTINLSGGTNFGDGRGNISGFVGYRKSEPVTQASRDYSACAFDMASESSYTCGGSSNSAYGKITSTDSSSPSYLTSLANNPDGSKTFVPYDSSTMAYNYSPTNYIQRDDKRLSAGLFAHYKFNEAFELYGTFIAMKDRSFSQVAPSAIWQGTNFTINCDNPLLSDSQKESLCGSTTSTADTTAQIGYRFAGLPRRDDLRHEDYRGTIGARGQINDNISYDISYLQSVVFYREAYYNDINQNKVANALQVVDVDGVATCKSVIDGTDPDCVPVDIFSTAGPSAEALAYLSDVSETRNTLRQHSLAGSINIDMGAYGVKSPWASDGVASVFGAESRVDSLNYVVNEVALSNGGVNSDGRVSTNEVYAEFNVPVIQDKPWVKDLTLDFGLRGSAYKASSSTTEAPLKHTSTWKVDGEYAPNSDIRFRASYNFAVRAPSISELFTAQNYGNVSMSDPCAGSDPSATLEQCELSGVSAAQYGSILECPSDQCTQKYGGNPDLDPEKAKTYTLGFVYTPTAVPSLRMSVDYYHIHVDDYISSVDPTLILNQCLTTGNSFFCNLIHRDPTTGSIYGSNLGYVISTNVNTGYLQTSGYDFLASYTMDLEAVTGKHFGKVAFDFNGTLLAEQVTEPLPGLGTYDCKGLFGPVCGNPNPTWRHTLRTTWSMPWIAATLSANWRHLDPVKLSSNTDNSYLAGTTSEIDRQIKAYDYLDLSATYRFGGRYTFRASANNVFDKDPPTISEEILTGYGNGNTYPGTYDPMGRTIMFGITADF
ncbi:MAG: TonB-dependent receptor [Asticcacaulis sp.]|uniref:TonB-dependent receptor domain-containing protein n=1 Tax=Asticcacaulis sp. TaxID=1872648 RepID=UPI0039E2A9D4